MNKLQVDLSQIIVTPEARSTMIAQDIQATSLLQNHFDGDWNANLDPATEAGDFQVWRMTSAQKVGQGELWVITEFDRHITTIALPGEC